MGEMIRSATLTEFAMMILVPLGLAAIALYAGWRARKRAALIKAMPKSNIAMADDGYRAFEGTIEPIVGKSVTSPLTRSQCVWYHAKVEESVASKLSKGGTGRHWKELKDTTSDVPFLVRDGTGACVVFPDGADVTPTDRSLWYGATAQPTDTNPLKVGPGESPRPNVEMLSGPDSKYRYSEERIYAGDPLLVLGEFTTGLATDNADVDEDDADARKDNAATKAAAGTKASIRYKTAVPPLILATTSRDAHINAMAKGGAVAFGIAAVPLAIAALIVWMRFS